MSRDRGAWGAFVARLAVTGVVVAGAAFVGVRWAQADPGGRTRNALTVAGTLTGAGASAMVTFRFRKSATVQCEPVVMVLPGAGGAFTAEVPLDQTGHVCPGALFDGSDVVVDVVVGGTTVVNGGAVNPVPYARYADQVGVGNECPAGYVLDATASPGIVCVRTVRLGTMDLRDEVVKVGTGASAFWVDRYEAAIHQSNTGTQLGTANTSGGGADDIASSGLSRSGQRPRGVAPAQALSHVGMPTVNVTWFQANEACRAAGKHLATRSEWLAAANGTTDDSTCNVSSGGARAAAATNSCVSAAGAHDMIGNLWEWTDEWYATLGNVGTSTPNGASPTDGWPVDGNLYAGDGTWNITSSARASIGDARRVGIPSAAFRGGNWGEGPRSGVFALLLSNSPSEVAQDHGFRCVVPN